MKTKKPAASIRFDEKTISEVPSTQEKDSSVEPQNHEPEVKMNPEPQGIVQALKSQCPALCSGFPFVASTVIGYLLGFLVARYFSRREATSQLEHLQNMLKQKDSEIKRLRTLFEMYLSHPIIVKIPLKANY